MPVTRRLQMVAPADDTPPFDPADVTGLTVWYNADDITGKSDGDAITTWQDSVGSFDVAQATGGLQPLYKTGVNGINSQPVVLFSADVLESALGVGLTLAQPFSIATVVKHSTAGAVHSMFVSDPLSNVIMGTLSGKWAMYAGSAFGKDASFSLDTNAHVIVGIFQGASSQLWIDGTQATLDANPGAGGWANKEINVGFQPGPTNHWNGAIAQLQLISGAISTPDRNGLEAAWGSNYGISVA